MAKPRHREVRFLTQYLMYVLCGNLDWIHGFPESNPAFIEINRKCLDLFIYFFRFHIGMYLVPFSVHQLHRDIQQGSLIRV